TPLVIAHRGASGHRPEHTLAAYRLALETGADGVEADLVLTADGAVVARHESELSRTTDVASRPELADRRRTREVDGRPVTGWFTEDLTLAEVRTLRARERMPDLRRASAAHDGAYGVVTLDEVLDLVTAESLRTGRRLGVLAELKHATHFGRLGLAPEEAVLAVLARYGLDRAGSPVHLQSFEPTCLRRLARRTALPLVQLVDLNGRPYDEELAGRGRTFADLLTPSGLREVSTYAEFVGVHKSLLVPRGPDGRLGRPSTLVQDAASAGLGVHCWTFRDENAFLPAELRHGSSSGAHGDAAAEYAVFMSLGVDAILSDHPGTAVAARAARHADQRRESSGEASAPRLARPTEASSPARPAETSSTGAATSRPGSPSTS
ncbi:MAG TPA: glycerophosphodiester phosphodiesterase family protein, partial [Jiangellales bacterium]|nr:glycerophosphodiester phosphodiesterase family protein [Jiangellales bacterium]